MPNAERYLSVTVVVPSLHLSLCSSFSASSTCLPLDFVLFTHQADWIQLQVYSKETLRSLLWDMSSTPEKEEMARQVPNTSSISSGKRKLDPEFEQPTTKKARIVRLNSSQLYAEAKQFKKLGDSISHVSRYHHHTFQTFPVKLLK